MHIMSEVTKDKVTAIVMERKDAVALLEIIDAAMNGTKLNKRSNAYKLAKQIDNELPLF